MHSHSSIIYITLTVAIVLLFVLSLSHGSVSIPLSEVWLALCGGDVAQDSWRFIVVESRLPQAVTALFAGASLAVSGLLLQTAFRNELAAPDVFGVTSGASLAVALLTLVPGFIASSAAGYLLTVAMAFVGAMSITALVWALSRMTSNPTTLIILGLMIGYLVSSLVSLLSYLASADSLKQFALWGMGSFSGPTLSDLTPFVAFLVLGLIAACLMIKPLNALLMGEEYAANLGLSVVQSRRTILIITGGLTAVVTAACGPVSFIALASPHISRLIASTSDHRRLLPTTMLTGSAIALLCNVITTLPSSGLVLPLGAVTPLIGAPVIIWVLIRKRG